MEVHSFESVPLVELCTLYLHTCQVRVTVGNSDLCCCVTYFKRELTPMYVDWNKLFSCFTTRWCKQLMLSMEHLQLGVLVFRENTVWVSSPETSWSTNAPAVMYLQCGMLVFRENAVWVSSPETQADQQLHQLWCIYSVSCWFSGRTQCECQALKHKLINNCTNCGRVVCEQEGAGPCLFCGKLVSAAFHLGFTPLFRTKVHSHIWISDAKV